MKRLSFAIPSLLAAGLVPVSASAGDAEKQKPSDDQSFKNQLGQIVEDLSGSQFYTLAGHSSHASHGSHGSHGSHRSGYYAPPVPEGEEGGISPISLQDERNMQSTPPSSVLPSSPAIAKKVKILPGNSHKFRDVVMRAQLALISKGYDIEKINGELDASTIAAIYRFQDRAGLVPSGKLTPEALSALGIIAQ